MKKYLKSLSVSVALFVAFPGCTVKMSNSELPPFNGEGIEYTIDPKTGELGARLGTGTNSSTVTWSPNSEGAVNKKGGGYRLYFQTTAGVDLIQARFVDVPYRSGAQAPVAVLLSGLESRTYYFKIVGYGAVKGVASTVSMSGASSEFSVALP